jgi:YgiT-type zinc finger domain-containing protein
MAPNYPIETITEQRVTHTLENNGQLVVIEKVPARVCTETGEQLFSPATVQRIHDIVQGHQKPARAILTPVYEFAE